LGNVAVRAGKLQDARRWFDKDLAVAQSLAAADPSNTGWQRDLSESYDSLGEIAVRAGKLEDARRWYDKDLAVRKTLATADPSNARWQRDLCYTLVKTAFVVRDPTVVTRYLDEARAIFGHLQRNGFFRGDEEFARLGTVIDRLSASGMPKPMFGALPEWWDQSVAAAATRAGLLNVASPLGPLVLRWTK